MTSLGPSWAWDSGPTATFTPQRSLVESLRVALATDTTLVMLSDSDKAFLIPKILTEYAPVPGTSVFLVASEEQRRLWIDFLGRNLNINLLDDIGDDGVVVKTTDEALKLGHLG